MRAIGQIITIAVIEKSFFDGNRQGYFGCWTNIDNSILGDHTKMVVVVTREEIQNLTFTQNSTGLETSRPNEV